MRGIWQGPVIAPCLGCCDAHFGVCATPGGVPAVARVCLPLPTWGSLTSLALPPLGACGCSPPPPRVVSVRSLPPSPPRVVATSPRCVAVSPRSRALGAPRQGGRGPFPWTAAGPPPLSPGGRTLWGLPPLALSRRSARGGDGWWGVRGCGACRCASPAPLRPSRWPRPLVGMLVWAESVCAALPMPARLPAPLLGRSFSLAASSRCLAASGAQPNGSLFRCCRPWLRSWRTLLARVPIRTVCVLARRSVPACCPVSRRCPSWHPLPSPRASVPRLSWLRPLRRPG